MALLEGKSKHIQRFVNKYSEDDCGENKFIEKFVNDAVTNLNNAKIFGWKHTDIRLTNKDYISYVDYYHDRSRTKLGNIFHMRKY